MESMFSISFLEKGTSRFCLCDMVTLVWWGVLSYLSFNMDAGKNHGNELLWVLSEKRCQFRKNDYFLRFHGGSKNTSEENWFFISSSIGNKYIFNFNSWHLYKLRDCRCFGPLHLHSLFGESLYMLFLLGVTRKFFEEAKCAFNST